MDEAVLASTIQPGDHFWYRGKLHLAQVVYTRPDGTWISHGSGDTWFAADSMVIRKDS